MEFGKKNIVALAEPHLRGHFSPRRNRNEAGLDAAFSLQDKADLHAADPLARAQELPLLVSNIHQALLYLPVQCSKLWPLFTGHFGGKFGDYNKKFLLYFFHDLTTTKVLNNLFRTVKK